MYVLPYRFSSTPHIFLTMPVEIISRGWMTSRHLMEAICAIASVPISLHGILGQSPVRMAPAFGLNTCPLSGCTNFQSRFDLFASGMHAISSASTTELQTSLRGWVTVLVWREGVVRGIDFAVAYFQPWLTFLLLCASLFCVPISDIFKRQSIH